jgi:hypothetical protein
MGYSSNHVVEINMWAPNVGLHWPGVAMSGDVARMSARLTGRTPQEIKGGLGCHYCGYCGAV